ncbi:MAG TPA: hypothetical protein VL992_18305 [Tepidisphaeraceae bacterium]|nr:hypothetical protein [Tepidisphaeraceae bacterium]
MLARLPIFLTFLLAAIVMAGAYGALHDQISYTVSPEYFTRFKFIKFQLLDETVPPRVRAAEVGVLASWWMGIPLGILTGLVGFIHRDTKVMIRSLAWSLVIMPVFALLFSLSGLLYGYLQTRTIDPSAYSDWYIPDGVQNLRNYICAGYMHGAGYLGGALAVPVAWIFHLIVKFKTRQPEESAA